MSDQEPTEVTGQPLTTADRLADALQAAGHKQLADRARGGYYDDYRSTVAFPKMALVRDLSAVGDKDFVRRVESGEFDNTEAEAKAWQESPEGQAALRDLAR